MPERSNTCRPPKFYTSILIGCEKSQPVNVIYDPLPDGTTRLSEAGFLNDAHAVLSAATGRIRWVQPRNDQTFSLLTLRIVRRRHRGGVTLFSGTPRSQLCFLQRPRIDTMSRNAVNEDNPPMAQSFHEPPGNNRRPFVPGYGARS